MTRAGMIATVSARFDAPDALAVVALIARSMWQGEGAWDREHVRLLEWLAAKNLRRK